MNLTLWKMRLAMLVCGVVVPAHCVSAQGTLQWTVTFDGNPTIPPGDEFAISFYAEQGMSFSPIGVGQFGRSGGSIPQRAHNGTAFLVAAFTYSLAVTGPARFALVSVDLAEYSTVVPDAATVRFVGYRHDGSVVWQEFTTDGVMDGMGPLADFQTFHFDSRFWDVVRVEVPTYGWSLDNMVFSNVIPEPRMGALLGLGGAALLVVLVHRKLRAKS